MLKVGIFYRDAFATGGVPSEIRTLAEALAVEHKVTLWGRRNSDAGTTPVGPDCERYGAAHELRRKFTDWLTRERPQTVLVVGFFLRDNLSVVQTARRHQVPIILYPLAQVMNEVLRGKVFTYNPDTRRLETGERSQQNFSQELLVALNPFLKRLYLQSIGKLLVSCSDRIAVFSAEEQRQFTSYFRRPNQDFIRLLWGTANETGGTDDPRHYYRDVLGLDDGCPNFVYWGRLDWHYKGLDRLLAGVQRVGVHCGSASRPFRLFLIGPDYRGGAARVASYLTTRQLNGSVQVLLPGAYIPGSKTPLRDADASLYLSRWDGFPRTLRESTMLGVPVLVSRETHFADVVVEHDSGIVLEDADDPDQVARALLQLSDARNRARWRQGSNSLAPLLAWSAIAQRFVKGVENGVD